MKETVHCLFASEFLEKSFRGIKQLNGNLFMMKTKLFDFQL